MEMTSIEIFRFLVISVFSFMYIFAYFILYYKYIDIGNKYIWKRQKVRFFNTSRRISLYEDVLVIYWI